jgi:L-lactate dehydrogenase complex protein LldG
MFAERAEAVGMKVRRVSVSELPGALVAVLKEIGAKSIVSALPSIKGTREIHAALAAAEISRRDWRDDSTLSADYDADAGVTDVFAALAETGTLIVGSSPDHGRGLYLAPPTHVAVVPASRILPDMLDYMAGLDARQPTDLPAGQTMITGPSKTADIEGILVTGVHGPERVFILLIEDM